MKATAIIQVHYPEREPNLGPILDAIQEVPEITQTIVWVNGDKYRVRFPRPGVEVIHASFNDMRGQYAAAFLATTPLIYYQDDDLVVESGSIRQLLDAARFEEPDTLFGSFGRNLDKTAAYPIAAGHWVTEGRCDVLLTRVFAATRATLLGRMVSLPPDTKNATDLVMSYGHAQVVPHLKWTDIPENGVGLCHAPANRDAREAWARVLVLGIPR